MMNRMLFRPLLFATAVLSVGLIAWPQPKPAVEVWVVGSSQGKVYHCPGSRWFGIGDGKKMSECEALHQGYRPAFGGGCGSSCLQSSERE